MKKTGRPLLKSSQRFWWLSKARSFSFSLPFSYYWFQISNSPQNSLSISNTMHRIWSKHWKVWSCFWFRSLFLFFHVFLSFKRWLYFFFTNRDWGSKYIFRFLLPDPCSCSCSVYKPLSYSISLWSVVVVVAVGSLFSMKLDLLGTPYTSVFFFNFSFMIFDFFYQQLLCFYFEYQCLSLNLIIHS